MAQRSSRPAVSSAAVVHNKRQAGNTDIYTLCRVNEDDGDNPEGGAAGKDANDDGGDHCGCVPATSASAHLANDPKHERAARTPRARDAVRQLARRHPSRQLMVCS